MGITRAQYLQGDSNDGPVLGGTVQGVSPGAGIQIDSNGVITLAPATTSIIGGVIPDGTTIKVTPSGVISTNDAAFLRQVDDISFSFDGTQTVFNLTIGGVPYTPQSVDSLLISLGGVLQIPGPAFTVSGSTLIFDTPPEEGTTFAGYVVANGGSSSGGGGAGSVTLVGTGTGLTGGPILTTGTISLKKATTSSLGGVIPDGTTITVNGAGVISAAIPPTVVPRIVNLGVLESVNGVNSVFTLCLYGTNTPYSLALSSNLTVFLGGVPQLPGISYSVSSNRVTFVTPPPANTDFIAITATGV